MVSPLNSPPPPPPGGGPAVEPGAPAQPEMQTTAMKLVGVREVTDMPLTNRGEVKEKISIALGLLSGEVCSAMASMEERPPREDVEARLNPGARETATGFDRHVISMLDTLLEVVAADEQASITTQTPEGRPYAEDNSDDDLPVSEGARNLWLSKLASMRLYAKDNIPLNQAVELAIRFSAQPDSAFSKGKEFTPAVLQELANELGLPVEDPFIQDIHTAFEYEHVAGDFEGLNTIERILLKTVVLNRFEFNEAARNVAQAFVSRYPDSVINPLLLQDEITVTTEEGQGGADGSDADAEGAAAGVARLRFS